MKSKLQRTVAALALALTTAWLTVSALASPPYVNYQGTINDDAGNPINNNSQPLTFNIYPAPTGGTAEWGPFNLTAPVLNGRFNVILGPTDTAGRSLDTVFNASNDRYLAVTVGGTTISPRQRFLANPYAYSASSVANPRYEITPSEFLIRNQNIVEFGRGQPKAQANNGTIGYGQFTSGLEIIGGGNTVADRLTTVYGNLSLQNAGVASTLTVNGNANVSGTVKANSITAPDNRVVLATRLADMSSVLGDLRIVRGRVSAAGIVQAGSQFSVSKGVNSTYTVTFDPAFAESPVVVATARERASGTPGTASLSTTPTASSVTFRIFGGTDRADLDFDFIAIGPR